MLAVHYEGNAFVFMQTQNENLAFPSPDERDLLHGDRVPS
jgi:hypothetical protein